MPKDIRKHAEIGSRVDDRWDVIRVFGEGAFGAVYEVSDVLHQGNNYALKVSTNILFPKR